MAEVRGIDGDSNPQEEIEGISLVRYARLTREMADAGIAGPRAMKRWLSAHGVDPRTWPHVAAGWSNRMVRFPSLGRRFEDLRTGTDLAGDRQGRGAE